MKISVNLIKYALLKRTVSFSGTRGGGEVLPSLQHFLFALLPIKLEGGRTTSVSRTISLLPLRRCIE